MTTDNQTIKQRKPAALIQDHHEEAAAAAAAPEKPITKKRKPLKFSDMPKMISYRLWIRGVVTIAVFVIVYFIVGKSKTKTFARQKETIALRSQYFRCSDTYLEEIGHFPSCMPRQCGRFVIDAMVKDHEVTALLELAKAGFAFGGSAGGASILDLHTGALSMGEKFVNVHKLPEAAGLLRDDTLNIYKQVTTRITYAISERFGIEATALHLTQPTFFSRITNAPAKNIHDEYWHEHVDKETYATFHYTSLLYLSDYKRDFTGGRFVFVDGDEHNRTTSMIEPKRGRISAFTSGAENLHNVEKVTSGTRYAMTISFTCNEDAAIKNSKLVTKN